MTDTPRIIIVNEEDEVIGYKERGTLKREDIYRVSSLWLTNSRGEILLAQRAFTKSHSPGKWGPAVAGTVEENETYQSNIIKETEEEIGLSSVSPIVGPKYRNTASYNYFCQYFTLTIDKQAADFVIQKEEVEQVKWISRAELEKELQNNPDQYLKGLRWSLDNL